VQASQSFRSERRLAFLLSCRVVEPKTHSNEVIRPMTLTLPAGIKNKKRSGVARWLRPSD
jgi:hypothetical protein